MSGDESDRLLAEAHGWDLNRPRFSEADRLLPQDVTIDAIRAEVTRARTKFPGNRLLLAALMEEVGELAKALLQKRPRDECDREAVQVACLAIRLIEEGDSSFDNLTDAEAKP